MTVTRDSLTVAFPEFGSEETYSADTIDFWIAQAATALDPRRFGRQLDLATMLFVAHNIALGIPAQRAEEAGAGGLAGATFAPVTSKAVDGVSKSYDVALTAFANAGPWNATTYGQRFFLMLRGAAAGPLYRVAPRCYGSRGRLLGWR